MATCGSLLGQDDAGLGNDGPLLLRDVVLMHIDVIAIGVEARVEHQRCVHERTRIHKAASLTNLHLFNIENEASIEDVESRCTFTTEQKDLVISDLVSQTHV